jgi:hypothetical protein
MPFRYICEELVEGLVLTARLTAELILGHPIGYGRMQRVPVPVVARPRTTYSHYRY